MCSGRLAGYQVDAVGKGILTGFRGAYSPTPSPAQSAPWTFEQKGAEGGEERAVVPADEGRLAGYQVDAVGKWILTGFRFASQAGQPRLEASSSSTARLAAPKAVCCW